jgi:hypothetical protein
MPSYFILSALFFALICTSAYAADTSPGAGDVVHGGGLLCFSIIPPRDRDTSCNVLCAAKDAACVGLKLDGAINPGFGCADALDPLKGASAVAACRCCAIAK